VIAQAFGYVVIEPGLVTKLNGVSCAFPVAQCPQKLLKPLRVLFQECWELPDHSSKTFAKGKGRLSTAVHRFFHIEQLLIMSDVTMTFYGKRKSFWCLVTPLLVRAFLL
jgi:hypothetical protein